MFRPRASAAGFTLIELVVVIAVIALVAAMAVPALQSITGADTRKAAGQLAGSMRALFDTAALRHATCRLALDLENRAFWAECAPGRAGISKDPEREPDARALEDRFPDEKDGELRRLLAKSDFGKFEDRLIGKRELPGRVAFGPVHVEGRRDAIETGIAYIHFFPGGQAQRAYVPVQDGKNLFTVVIEPFTGRARVTPGKVEVRQ